MKLRNSFYVRRTSGNSMFPTIEDSKLVFGLRKRKYKVGDIVMIKHNGIDKIKRIKKIKNNEIYVLGDNPSSSTDSRYFGYIKLTDVFAKVILLK